MTRQEAVELIDELFASWYPCLFRFLLRATQNVEQAEDIVQETFTHLYRNLARGRTVDNPRAWTLCVARRHLRRYVSGRRNAESLEELENLPAAGWTPCEWTQFEEVLGNVAGLSRREEEALLLRLEGLKYREIAEQLGISPNTVTTLLMRGLAKLKARIRGARSATRFHRMAVKRGATAL